MDTTTTTATTVTVIQPDLSKLVLNPKVASALREEYEALASTFRSELNRVNGEIAWLDSMSTNDGQAPVLETPKHKGPGRPKGSKNTSSAPAPKKTNTTTESRVGRPPQADSIRARVLAWVKKNPDQMVAAIRDGIGGVNNEKTFGVQISKMVADGMLVKKGAHGSSTYRLGK